MQIKYTLDAFASLTTLLNYIESKNTQGAGLRWLESYESFLTKELINIKRLSFCKNAVFNKLQLNCIYFNEWLIAISIHEDFILVEAFLHKSRIKD